MKVSLVTTVLNEEKTIKSFFESVLDQTGKPDEVVIIDGGSEDTTLKKVRKFKSSNDQNNFQIKIWQVRGANRSVGRNEGIKRATGEIIAVSDAGCVLDKNWLENLIKPFSDPAVAIVAGFYQPLAKTIFEKCIACYTCAREDQINPENFLPSSRSVAFRRAAWEKVGGYPEELNYCEDLVFDQRLKDAGLKFAFARDALVFWPQRKDIWQALTQFFHYASGDAEALYWPHLRKIGLVYLRYLIGLICLIWLPLGFLVIGLLGYFAFAVWKNYRYVRHPLALFWLPVLQLAADLGVLAGTAIGFWKRWKK
ncbi:glycosyltransferase [Candidatus Shapirobacteria bacterium]|nr:glycosyltransferase [Candidatus Shapirobacteria bacterium]